MRILFVVPNVPSPIRPRPFYFLRHLSKTDNVSVSVLCLASNDADERFISDLRQYCQALEVIRLSRWKALANCFSALFSGQSLRCAYFHSSALRDRLAALVKANEVDLIHAEHLKSMSMLQPVLGKVPALFDAVDCVSMLERRRCSVTKNPLLKLFARRESKHLARSEANASRQFSRVIISSPVDRDAYPSSYRGKIDVVPNGVDLQHFGFRQWETQKDLLVFCAKLDYFPNEDAAMYFAHNIWPLLKSRRPQLRLEIVGSRPGRKVRRLDGKNGIRVKPSVPDIRPYLGRASVALCPIRIRAGIQNKLLEAMALGVPIVATPVCQEGLDIEPGKHLLLAKSPSQFAAAVELLFDNTTLRENIVREARAYVERQHDWAESARSLSASYEKAIAEFLPRTSESAVPPPSRQTQRRVA